MSEFSSELQNDEVVELRGPRVAPQDDGWGVNLPTDFNSDDELKARQTKVAPEQANDGWIDEAAEVPTNLPTEVPQNSLPVFETNYRSDDGWGGTSTELHERDGEARLVKETVDFGSNDAALADADDAAEAAFQLTTDLATDTDESSEFKRRVAASDAQQVESLTEAEDYARENLGVDEVDFSDFDLRVANEVNATLEVLQDKYPEVGGLEYLGTIQARNEAIRAERPRLAEQRPDLVTEPSDGTVAVALARVEGFNGVTINKDWAIDYGQTSLNTRQDELVGESARDTGSMSGVIAHEFGHLVENHLRDIGRFEEVDRELDAIQAQGRLAVTNEVSGYANKSKHELFAEAFAEYQLSDSPRPVAQLVGRLVDNVFHV